MKKYSVVSWILLLSILAVVAIVVFQVSQNSSSKPAPTATPAPPLTPTVTRIPPSLPPTFLSASAQQCISRQTSCANALVELMNIQRRAVGSPALRLDWCLTKYRTSCGAKTCVTAQDHANHLVQFVHTLNDFGQYAHDQFGQSCAARTGLAGQNVGEMYGGKYDAIIGDFSQMMAEGNKPLGSCLSGHDCNITNRSYTRVATAFAFSNELNAWMVVQDFAGGSRSAKYSRHRKH